MNLFLIAFFLIYGGMHLYVFLKARAALGFGRTAGVPVSLFMLFMVLAPIIVRFMESGGLETEARVLSHICYVWLGLVFLFISASLCMDVYRLAVSAGGLLAKKDTAALLPSPRAAFYVPLVLSLAISVYGAFEAWDIRTEKITITTSKLPPEVSTLRVVQISDVHVGLIVRKKRLEKILDAIRALEPDMLVSTGDLVDGQINGLPGLAELLQEVTPRYGKFAITGNHEFYAGLDQALRFTENSGFKVLRGEAVSGVINIAGVDDLRGRDFKSGIYVSEGELLSNLPREKFTLVLKHRPFVDRGARGLFDLQLSGHTHKGQIFPFYLLSRLLYPASGRHDHEDGSVLYFSRGTGTWGPPVRFLAPPEVTLIEIVREK